MASWKEERDRLVAQTLAFVQQVAAAHPGTARKLGLDLSASAIPALDVAPSPAEILPAEMIALPAPDASQPPCAIVAAPDAGAADIIAVPTRLLDDLSPRPQLYATQSERAEIARRVATFQARQQTLNREREAYYETMRERIRVSLGNGIADRRL